MKYVNSVSRSSVSKPVSRPVTFPTAPSTTPANDNFREFRPANDNRPVFNWSVARPRPWAVSRVVPWLSLAITALTISAVIFRKKVQPDIWNFTGYQLILDCGGDAGYRSTLAAIPGCGVWAVNNSAVNYNFANPRPVRVYEWFFVEPRNESQHWATAVRHWRRQTVSGPAVYTPGAVSPQVYPRPSTNPQFPPWADPYPVPETLPVAPPSIPPPVWVIPSLDAPPMWPEGQRETGPAPQPRPRPEPARPWPRRRKREDKKRAKGVLNTALQLVKEGTYTVTEVMDAVECLWNAIPPWKKPKPWKRLGDIPGAQAINPNARVVPFLQKQHFVMNNIDLIDWASTDKKGNLRGALPCLMMNSLIDLGIGVTSGMAQSEATKRRVILGLLG